MTTPKSTFDESHPSFNAIALPLIVEAEDADLMNAMAHTLNHLGLLYYQVFLKALEAHWPAELKSLTVTHDGEGYLALGMTERPPKSGRTDYDYNALTVFRRHMMDVGYGRPSSFYHLVNKGFQQGERRVKRQDLPGLFLAVLEGAQLARVQAAMLTSTLPEANMATPSKAKF